MAQLHLLSPDGFRAAGVYAGIKSTRKPDVGLLVCDHLAATAAVFTRNKVFAAPIQIGRQHVRSGWLRGVVVNSGNANACTGKQGEIDAMRMCELAGQIFGTNAQEFLPSSTGIIGRRLPMEKIARGIRLAGQKLGREQSHALDFLAAIMTTDIQRKAAAVQFKIGGKTVRLAGVCKGSGMIGPRLGLAPHATMLAYLTCDAAIAPLMLRRALAAAAEQSFNAVTVDDQTSTNDTAAIMCSGFSGAKVAGAASLRTFGKSLTEVCQDLARQIAADGEGATKLVCITVSGAADRAGAAGIARSIANSPLVKCAMNGNDPNWGRILVAAGLTAHAFDPQRCVLKLQGTVVFRSGSPVKFDAARLSRALDAKRVNVDLACALGDGDATVWTCDLSKEYVTINADYHT